MSQEEPNSQPVSKEVPAPSTSSGPTITEADLERVRNEAKAAVKAEYDERHRETEKRFADQARKAGLALAGLDAEEEDDGTELVREFVKDPKKVLSEVVNEAKRSAKAEFAEELVKVRAFDRVFAQRPDLDSLEAKKAIAGFYATADGNLSEEERLKEAVKQYDHLVEKHSGVSAAERVARATGIKPGSDAAAAESKPKPKSESDVFASEIEEIKASYAKKTGRAAR